MRVAVVADVHGNAHALAAVLEAVARFDVDEVLCLGDIVGYGSMPTACISMLRRCRSVAGNHELDVLGGQPSGGNSPPAVVAQVLTAKLLTEVDRTWLESLPRCIVEPGAFVAVHGCFINDAHAWGYVTSTMLERNLTAISTREGWPRFGLCGHTHIPLLGWIASSGECVEPRLEPTMRWPSDARAVLLNPGSVGQPRDGDPRAAFAVLDLDARMVRLERVTYDVEAAARAIREAGFPPSLAERLLEGR